MICFDDIRSIGHYDTAVIGGGLSGVAAAVAAAKEGLNTLLVEEKSFLGGTAGGAGIGLASGLADDENDDNVKGVLRELIERLRACKGAGPIETFYMCNREDLGVKALSYDPVALREVLDDMVQAAGVHTLLHTREIAAHVENGKIVSVALHNVEGICQVTAYVFIDASFHGSLAVDAGCSWEAGDPNGVLQPGTLIYFTDGVDSAPFDAFTPDDRIKLAEEGIAEGKLVVKNIISRPLPNGLYQTNMGRVPVNPLDSFQWSEAEQTGRRQARCISEFFRDRVPGFERARMVGTGEFLGLRDSRRIMGKYVLRGQDILDGIRFEDAIARSSYPVDIHDTTGSSSVLKKPKTGEYFIPYDSLVTNEIGNLLLAGRCISADYEAHSALRVMLTCLRIGEAAGMAAAECSRQNIAPNTLDGRIISEKLLGRS